MKPHLNPSFPHIINASYMKNVLYNSGIYILIKFIMKVNFGVWIYMEIESRNHMFSHL